MKQGVSELLPLFYWWWRQIGGRGWSDGDSIKKPAEAGSKPKLLLLVSDGCGGAGSTVPGFTMNLDSVSK